MRGTVLIVIGALFGVWGTNLYNLLTFSNQRKHYFLIWALDLMGLDNFDGCHG